VKSLDEEEEEKRGRGRRGDFDFSPLLLFFPFSSSIKKVICKLSGCL
jgi:hypothetical protein